MWMALVNSEMELWSTPDHVEMDETSASMDKLAELQLVQLVRNLRITSWYNTSSRESVCIKNA